MDINSAEPVTGFKVYCGVKIAYASKNRTEEAAAFNATHTKEFKQCNPVIVLFLVSIPISTFSSISFHHQMCSVQIYGSAIK